MAEYNVTRDIRKLAEEAERNKTQDLTLAGLGLGGGFVASQTGGSATNPRQPTNLTIQANEAQARANRAKADKQFKNLGNLNTSTQVTISDPKIEKNPFPKPTFTAEPKMDTRPGTGGSFSSESDPLKGVTKRDPNAPIKTNTTSPKPKVKAPLLPEFKGMPTGSDFKTFSPKKQVGNVFRAGGSLAKGAFDPRTFALFGGYEAGNLIGLDEVGENIGEVIGDKLMTEDRLGLANFYANITGGTDPRRPSRFVKGISAIGDAYNTVTDVAGNVLEGTARLIPETADYIFSSNPQTDNPFASAYSKAFNDGDPQMNQEVLQPNDEIGQRVPLPQPNNGIEQRTPLPQPNDQMGTKVPITDLDNRSPLEKQIIRNQQAGQPLLAGTFEDQQINQAFGGEGVPSYQANFLQRKQQEEPITDAEFQRAQQFALKRGMVFDPETGYSKADFFGQMFKGQTIGQFLRGEDAPEGFTDVIGQTADPREEARKSFEQASREREQRIADRPDFMEAVPDKPEGELSLGDYRNLARAQGFRGSAQIAEAKRLMREDQRKDELTPYQKETLGLQKERLDLGKEQFKQAKLEYKEGVERGLEADQLANMYKKVQILGLINNLIPQQDELGFDLDPDVINDYVGVLKEFGVEYDPETDTYKQDGMFGKQLDKEDLAKLSPLLKETKFIKLLEYTSKNNQ